MKAHHLGLLALILTGLVLWQVARPKYSTDEVHQAALVVEQYYQALDERDYGRALASLAIPVGPVRDWQYEKRYMEDELGTLAAGEYRLAFRGHVSTPLGNPNERYATQPLGFYVNFDTVQNGKPMFFGEIAYVNKVNGQFRITDFDSVDHYIRFRAFTFRLPRVVNSPTATK